MRRVESRPRKMVSLALQSECVWVKVRKLIRGFPGEWGFCLVPRKKRDRKRVSQIRKKVLRDEKCQDYKWRSFQPPTHSRSPMS